jgi:tight adherence protein C
VADNQENTLGEAMKVVEFIPVCILMLPGLLILMRLTDRIIRSGLIRRIAADMVHLHAGAYAWLLNKGFLRFPGAHLVTSLRGWAAGESVFIMSAVLVSSFDFSLLETVLILIFGLLVGGMTIALSFREEARKKIDAVRSALPVASFMMSLMMEAGMGSSAAMREVVQSLPNGPLANELDQISRSRLLGISRMEAIEKSRSRIPLDDHRAFLNLIEQGERLGISLTHGLRELSSRMMESQAHRAETMAQKASVKMLLPLVLFIFPSVFLIILSPVILNLLDMLRR